MKVLSFLQDTGPDHQGRFLSDILKFDDAAIEATHDFIQWIFPLDELSSASPDAPKLEPGEIALIRKSSLAAHNLNQSVQWFCGFLGRNAHWRVAHDHNHLRITRMIKSVRLLQGEPAANALRDKMLAMAESSKDKISPKALTYWRQA